MKKTLNFIIICLAVLFGIYFFPVENFEALSHSPLAVFLPFIFLIRSIAKKKQILDYSFILHNYHSTYFGANISRTSLKFNYSY